MLVRPASYNRAMLRVIEGRQDVALARHPLREPRARPRPTRQLEGNGPFDHPVGALREPHGAHATFPELAQNLVGTRLSLAAGPRRPHRPDGVCRSGRLSGSSPERRPRRPILHRQAGGEVAAGRRRSPERDDRSTARDPRGPVRVPRPAGGSSTAHGVDMPSHFSSAHRRSYFNASRSSSRAFSQSRRTVRVVTPNAMAISVSVRPPKYRISTHLRHPRIEHA